MTEIAYPRGNQAAQEAFLRDVAPGWSLYQGGWGSGKTWAASRKFLYLHGLNQCPGLAVAPTYGDIWRFVVPALIRTLDEWRWPYRVVRSEVPRLDVGGQTIYLISGEHPERFAGFEVGHLWIDEGARIQSSLEDPLRDAPLQIRGRLRHPGARVLHGLVSTTPEGTETWVQRDWFDKPLPAHRWYRGATSLNTDLDPAYTASLTASIPAELSEQYLAGKAVSFVSNRAHPTFSRARHVKTRSFNPQLPVHIGCDYNVSPMCWSMAQVSGDDVTVLDEVYLPDFAQVDSAVHAADARLREITGKTMPAGNAFVHFWPDRSAKSRSTVGDPEYVVMSDTAKRLGWNFTGDAHGVNPPVNARINLVSRMLLDATGKSRLSFHPRCVHLLEDVERTARASNGYDPGPDGKRGHFLDGLGYLLWGTCEPVGKAGVSSLL